MIKGEIVVYTSKDSDPRLLAIYDEIQAAYNSLDICNNPLTEFRPYRCKEHLNAAMIKIKEMINEQE